MILRRWRYATERKRLPKVKCPKGMGTVYVVQLKVMKGFNLLKIGATADDARESRLGYYKKEFVKMVAVSPPHINFWENESILHDFFKSYRVPNGPIKKSSPELFNVPMTFFFKNMPDLRYVQEANDDL